MKYLALLALVEAALGVAILPRATSVTNDIILDVVNGDVAPDGFTRSSF